MLKKFSMFLIAICIIISVFASVSFANDIPDGWVEVPFIGDTYREYNLSDVSLLLKHVAKWDVDIYEYFHSYDMDNNNVLNLSDASLILKRIAGHSI